MKEISAKCLFKNERLTFQSYLNEFSEEIFKQFDIKAKKIDLLKKIDDLFCGEKVNYTENLAAWHPKYRDQYDSNIFDTPSIKGQEKELQILSKACSTAKNIVTIGIGGSFEGPKMFLEASETEFENTNFLFLTGSDSKEFQTKISKLNPKNTLFLVSSKSFTTEEIILTLKDAISWSGKMNKFIAITSNEKEAKKYKIKNIIKFDKEIGGRYSIWSEISVLMYLLKKDAFDDFIAGGRQADSDLKKDDSYLKFVKTLAYNDIWSYNYKNISNRAVLSYIWSWKSLPNYIQQLEMESLGKQPAQDSEFKKTGQIIFGGYGPTAQHSYFQLLHQGTHDICADIIASKQNKKSLAYAQAITQSKLLSQGSNVLTGNEKINGNIPTNLFLVNSPGLYELGYLIATWEHRVYITALMLGINPFDQFGVSAGKIYTKEYLAQKE